MTSSAHEFGLSSEHITHLYEFFAKTAVKLFNESVLKECAPQLFLLELELGRSGIIKRMVPVHPDMAAMFFQSDPAKDLLSLFLRRMLGPETLAASEEMQSALGLGHVDAVVQISEAWLAHGAHDKRPPSERPDRQEVVLVCVHTREGSFMGMNPIQDHPERRCEFQPLAFPPGRLEGRLTVPSSSQGPVH